MVGEKFGEKFNKQTAEAEKGPEKKTSGVAESAESLFGKINQYAFSEETGEVIGDYFSGKILKSEFQKKLEEIDQKEKNIGKAIDKLESAGFITGKDEKGNLIVDVNKLKNFTMREHAAKLGLTGYTGETDKYSVLYRIFKNRGVISKDDFEKGVREPKDLIFSPKTKEEAFSVANLKEGNFYFSFLDFEASTEKGSHRVRVTKGLEPYSSLADKSLSRMEVAALLLIYNKNYGDGYRDKNGVLWVRDKDTREYKKIAGDFFKKYAFGAIKSEDHNIKFTTLYSSPRRFVEHFLPHIGAELLSPEDFRIVSNFPAAKEQRITREILKSGRNQYVMLSGVGHYLGPEFQGKHLKIYQIREDLAAVSSVEEKGGKEKITHVFKILKPEERLKTKSGYYMASKEETGLEEYNEKDFFVRRPDETEGEYGQRIEAMSGFQFMMDFSKDLQGRAGIDLRKWSFNEQKIISAAARTFNYRENREKILSFAERFGEDGLKTFLTAEYDMKNGQKVLEIAESMEEKEAGLIFAQYGKVLKSAESFYKIFDEAKGIRNSSLPPELKNVFAGEVREAIIRRSKDVLMALYPIAVEKRQAQVNVKDVASALQGLRIFLEVAQGLSAGGKDYKIEKANILSDRSFIFTVAGPDSRQYKFKIFIRPLEEEITRDGQKHIDQARINFELDFNTERPNEDLKAAFKQTQYDKAAGKSKIQHVLRIGIDRDVISEASPERKISMDLGRNEFKGERMERSGDVLGKVLHLTTETGHHNPKSFDQRFARADYFGEMAELFKDYLAGRIREGRA